MKEELFFLKNQKFRRKREFIRFLISGNFTTLKHATTTTTTRANVKRKK